MRYLILISLIFCFVGCNNSNEPNVDLYIVEDDIGITLVMENTGDGMAENIDVDWENAPIIAADGSVAFDEDVRVLSPGMERRVFTKMRILCNDEDITYTYPYTLRYEKTEYGVITIRGK